MRVLRCFEEIYLKFNDVSRALEDNAALIVSRGSTAIENPHLSPLLLVLIERYFGKRASEVFELRGGKVVLSGRFARRVAAQYVYTAFWCLKEYVENAKVCRWFEEAFDLPESKLTRLNESDPIMEFLEYVRKRERDLQRLAEEIAAKVGERFAKFSEAYAKAKEMVKDVPVSDCEKNLLASMIAKRLVVHRGVDKDEVKKALLSGDFTKLPPCIRSILERMQRGENVSHFERFTIATYLLNYLGMSVDEVLQLFSTVPDFNPKIAKYQLEHIAGLRGSMKKYAVPSCQRLKLEGICKWDCGVRNPAQYGRVSP